MPKEQPGAAATRALAARFKSPKHFEAWFDLWCGPHGEDDCAPAQRVPEYYADDFDRWCDAIPPEDFCLPGDPEPKHEIDEDTARRVWCDSYRIEYSPSTLRALCQAPDDDAREKLSRDIVASSRLATGESLEVLIDDGYLTEADLDFLDDDDGEAQLRARARHVESRRRCRNSACRRRSTFKWFVIDAGWLAERAELAACLLRARHAKRHPPSPEAARTPSAQSSQAGPPLNILDESVTPEPSSSTPRFDDQRIDDAEALAQVMHQPTEDNVALLFQRECHARFRYCKEWGCWLVWDGARWRAERTDAALDFSRALARKVNAHGKSSIAKASFARGVESLARAARCFATVPEDWDQDEFALNTPAGVIDLRTGTMRSHSGKEYVTKVTRVSPQPGPRPVFDRFMRQITRDDEALVGYHQRSLGATLSGARADHWLLFWIGTGRNGKNTLGELVEWILGDYAKTIPTETLMTAQSERHPTELANLRALRLAISSEVPEGAHWNESRIKSLTGDGSISARYMRADFFEFPRGHKHLVYGNHRPLLRVVDDAIRARMHVVPFRATFSDELGNRDPLLPGKLRDEAPTILDWLIDGHLQWISDGYTLRCCEAVNRETADYFDSQSTPDLWIAERCELVPNDRRSTGSLEKGSELYQDYAAWKDRRGEHPMGAARFGEWLSARFPKVKSDSIRYRGIRLELPRFRGRFSAWVTSGYPQAARWALDTQPRAPACG